MQVLHVATVAAISCALLPVVATAQSPDFHGHLVGQGLLINDMNEAGEVVGWTTVTGGVQAFVAGPRHPFETLPLAAGYNSAWAQGINDHGVVVGSTSTGGFPEFGVACAWYPDGLGGWDIQIFGALPGHTQSVAYAVNNRGDIVGWSLVPGFQGGPTVWFNSPTGLLDISAFGTTGNFAPSGPKGVNDEGLVVGTSGNLFDLDTLQVIPLPALPTGWNTFQGWAINDAGELAGTSFQGSQRAASIWTQAGGWEDVSSRFGSSASVQAFDINNAGYVTSEVPTPALHFPGFAGSSSLASLMAPAEQGRWSFGVNLGNAINDSGYVAAIGTDVDNQASGVVVLIPSDCQEDLGFQGPGTAGATLCGGGLGVGETSTYRTFGAPLGASGVLLVSTPGGTDVPVLGGTLVSFGGFAAQAPLLADGTGAVDLVLPGTATPLDLVLQSVFLDSRLPAGVAFTNAVRARFGQ